MRKKMRSRWLAALLSLTLAAGLMPAALAEGEEESQPPEIAVTEVRLDKREVSLKKGETLKLEAEVLPEDATNKTVHWTSSREAVATVEDGLVTAVSPGEADIFVTTDGGLYATCAVTVEEPVSGIVLNKVSLSLKVGGTETLTATVSPENATNKAIKWTSTKENVATVKDGQVTAVGVGTTTIAAITDDDGKTATCTVTVEADTAPAISLSSSAINVSIGGTASLTANVTPAGQTVTWLSSNTSLATVDAAGTTVTVRVPSNAKVGSFCTITATVGTGEDTRTAECRINVVDMSLSLSQTNLSMTTGKTSSLSVSGIPSGASYTVSWQSSNTSVVTLSSATTTNNNAITLTARSVGRATITVTPKVNGKTYSNLTCTVTVINAALADVTYTTSAGVPVAFNADHFNTAVTNSTGYSLNYVRFTLPATSRGILYYDYNTSTGNYDSKVSASTSYYRSSSRYLSDVTFVPESDYTGTVNIAYTAVDSNGSSITGQVVITVTQQQAKVTYATDANQAVEFDSSDFNSACKKITGYSLDYVKFTLPSSNRGVLYLNYGSSGEKKVTSSTSYYRGESPDLSNVTFVPAKNYTGIVSISFTGRDTDKNTVSGTVKIAVGQEPGDVNYTVTAGQSVTFDDGAFNDWCKGETGYSLDYVNFTLPGSGKGTLYYKYNAKDGSYDKKVAASTNYYRSGSPYLEYVTFVPANGTAGTVEIEFTGRDTNKRSVSGTVSVKVVPRQDPGTIRYTTGISPVRFQPYDFSNAFDTRGGTSLSSVKFTLPDPSRGKLYYDYTGPASYGGLVSSGTAYGLSGSNAVSRVAFVPKYGYQGTFTLNYTGTDTAGYEYKGAVEITVTTPTVSSRFSDMGQYGWAAASADFLAENGITTGTGDGRYDPAGLMTRGDFVLMLYRAFDLPKASGYSFDDVPVDSYYANAIASAKNQGIAKGSDGKFEPAGALTRQDAMVLLHRTLDAVGRGLGNGWSLSLLSFTDGSSVAEYAQGPVAALVKAGVIQGDDSGRLNPTGSLTRAEMAVILHRVLTL
ncbi:Ig-like domain-containing protein [Pseudoflavonifractor phocaeensis]|uniref:Ig-like domain-containing protein n=1 Tax=Pseudoflavonifractor phocaeensis TaxID=1870988 RepID=UPI00313C9967